MTTTTNLAARNNISTELNEDLIDAISRDVAAETTPSLTIDSTFELPNEDADNADNASSNDTNQGAQSTWDMTPEDVAVDAQALQNELDIDLNLNDLRPHGVYSEENPEPSEDGSVESEMTEELFRDRN